MMITLVKCLSIFVIGVLTGNIQSEANTIDENDLIVQLIKPVGKIRGHVLQSGNGKDYYAFQQIPYAAPPVNNLRFKAPQEHANWNGILNTTANTKKCPQIWVNELPQSEDCLYLNVYTPVKPNSNKKLAVYFWIFGGGFIIGDNSIFLYDPKYFMDYNVIVVTVSYRLGALGFLTTDDGVIQGNLGLRDQHFALKWVQENIYLFGGDPKKVTIGGESAGAASACYQMLSVFNNDKFFRGVIQQSGTALNRWAYQNKPAFYAFKLGKLLDSSLVDGNSTQLLEILLKAKTSEIIDAQHKVVNREKVVGLVDDNIWNPVVETSFKQEPFIDYPMHQTFVDGHMAKWNKVPTLIGFNSEEAVWYLAKPNKSDYELTMDQVKERAVETDKDPSNLISDKLNIPKDKKTKTGAELKKLYTNTTFVENLTGLVKFTGDAFIVQPIIRQAVLQAKYVDVYFYQFSYTPRNYSLLPGAEHTEELLYFWGGEMGAKDPTEFQKKLRHRMLKLWTNFIKYQNPTPERDEELNYILWPQQTSTKYLDISERMEIRLNPRNYIKYENIIDRYVLPPLYVF